MVQRTSLKLPQDRRDLLEQASRIVSANPEDEPPRADVIDAALTHLVESYENIDDARDEHSPDVIQDIANTSVIGLHYRTSTDSKWR